MKLLENIKHWYIQKKISEAPARKIRKFHYLNHIKNIGVIIDAANIENVKRIEDFISFLKDKGHKIEELNIIKRKIKKNEDISPNTISIYGLKWLNSVALTNFCEKVFDILIIFSFKEIIEINYICKLSKAELKVSPHYPELNCADLTFMLKKESKPKDFFDAIKKYLIENIAEEEAI